MNTESFKKTLDKTPFEEVVKMAKNGEKYLGLRGKPDKTGCIYYVANYHSEDEIESRTEDLLETYHSLSKKDI